MTELQIIPARHGTATFVPAGHVIKIINSSGSQVVDTWAFALPNPAPKKEDAQAEEGESKKEEPPKKQESAPNARPQSKTKKRGMNLPSQEDAEKATQQAAQEGEGDGKAKATQQKSTWSSYVPTSYVPTKVWPSFGKDGKKGEQQSEETEQQKNSRTWASYFPSGKGFTSYIPQTATDSVSAFAAAVTLHTSLCERSVQWLTHAIAPTRPQQKLHGATTRPLQNPRRSSRLER